jgi:hypothetical protein
MPEAIAPLSVSVRMSDADYPGVVAHLGPLWRLSVDMACKRYTLQTCVQTDEGARWVTAGGRSPSTLPKLLAKFGAVVDGLADACNGLPQDPAQALPEFAASRRALVQAFTATDWARDDFAGEIDREGPWRVVVTPAGDLYQLQWCVAETVGTGLARWRVVCASPEPSELVAFARAGACPPLRASTARKLVAGLCARLPSRASVVRSAALPARPLTLSEARRKRSAQR